MLDSMTEEDYNAIGNMRKKGFAVAVFIPSEMTASSADEIEIAMTQAAWQLIAANMLANITARPMGEAPHPYAAIFHAIADGKTIQVRKPSGYFKDCDPTTILNDIMRRKYPPHDVRIKPLPSYSDCFM